MKSSFVFAPSERVLLLLRDKSGASSRSASDGAEALGASLDEAWSEHGWQDTPAAPDAEGR